MTNTHRFARATVALKGYGFPTIKDGRAPGYGAEIKVFDHDGCPRVVYHLAEPTGDRTTSPRSHLLGIVEALAITSEFDCPICVTTDYGPVVQSIRGEAKRDLAAAELWARLDKLCEGAAVEFQVRKETACPGLVMANALAQTVHTLGERYIAQVSRVTTVENA